MLDLTYSVKTDARGLSEGEDLRLIVFGDKGGVLQRRGVYYLYLNIVDGVRRGRQRYSRINIVKRWENFVLLLPNLIVVSLETVYLRRIHLLVLVQRRRRTIRPPGVEILNLNFCLF